MKMGIWIVVLVVALCCAVVMGQLVVPDEESTAHTCKCAHFSHDCPDCDSGRCCSPAHYCGSTDAYCTPCSSPNICDCYPEYCNPSAGQAQKLEDTSKPRYNNNNNNATDNENTIIATYDRNFSSTASSLTAHDNMLVAWRSNYGRATICGSSSTLAKHQDGAQCLKVSSSENGKQAVVRVVQNECSNPSMVLDYDVFQQLHNGGSNAGNAKDQLLISYMYVHCMDY